jgi:hypothetical protein
VAAGAAGAAVSAGAAGAAVGAGEAHPETRTAIVKNNTNKVFTFDFISMLLFVFSIE